MQANTHDRDPLTGVHTRASLIERLQTEVARARRYGEPFSVLMLDLDYFKSINDAFGHLRGDQVLVQFTARLKAILRGSDLIFRYGGDEFVLLLPQTEKNQAGVVARRLLEETLGRPFAGDPPVSLALSIGVASFPEDTQTSADLLEVADQRHYQAKRNGRSQVVDDDLHKRTMPILNPPDRLVERDQPMSVLNDFFRQLIEAKQGVLQITGPSGAGKSRFLVEAGRVARLQRQVVLDLVGKTALKHRRFGALLEARWPWYFNPAYLTDVARFADLLAEWMAHKEDAGLVIAVDDAHEIDAATIQFLQELLIIETPFQLGILMSRDQNMPVGLDVDVQLKREIQLTPLSYEGTRVWLRQSLHWETPPPFLRWIFTETRGLPGEIMTTLGHMIESGALVRRHREWLYRGDLEQLPVSDWLRGEKSLPQKISLVDSPDFIGRVEELRLIREGLRANRLVTVCGPAGSGKTRLTLQSALEEGDQFPDGMLFQAFTQYATPEVFTAELARHLQIEYTPRMNWQSMLRNMSRQRQALLFLDDAGDVNWHRELVSILLESASAVHVLITACDPLHIAGEKVVEIGGLQCPPEGSQADSSVSYDAIQLFISCVRKNAPLASITMADIQYVEKIVRLLHGLPLGIQLAAAWVPAFYPHEIAIELERRLLQPGWSTDREQKSNDNLDAIIETFWYMLSEPEQVMLSRLSVFRGEFTAQAARQIAGASPFFIDAIAAKAFINRTAHGTYHFRERLRSIIYHNFQWNAKELDMIQETHVRYYLGLVNQYQQGQGAMGQPGYADLAHASWNIRTAWQWAVATRAVDLVREVVSSLCMYYHQMGSAVEAHQVCIEAIALLSDAPADASKQQVLDALQVFINQIR